MQPPPSQPPPMVSQASSSRGMVRRISRDDHVLLLPAGRASREMRSSRELDPLRALRVSRDDLSHLPAVGSSGYGTGPAASAAGALVSPRPDVLSRSRSCPTMRRQQAPSSEGGSRDEAATGPAGSPHGPSPPRACAFARCKVPTVAPAAVPASAPPTTPSHDLPPADEGADGGQRGASAREAISASTADAATATAAAAAAAFAPAPSEDGGLGPPAAAAVPAVMTDEEHLPLKENLHRLPTPEHSILDRLAEDDSRRLTACDTTLDAEAGVTPHPHLHTSPNGLRRVRDLSCALPPQDYAPPSPPVEGCAPSTNDSLDNAFAELEEAIDAPEPPGSRHRHAFDDEPDTQGRASGGRSGKLPKSSSSLPDIASMERQMMQTAPEAAAPSKQLAQLPEGDIAYGTLSDVSSSNTSANASANASAASSVTASPFRKPGQPSGASVPAPMRLRRSGSNSSLGSSSSGSSRRLTSHSPTKYDPHSSPISGFLIDLDGTVYRPNALIAGTRHFHEWLVHTGKPFVYLSNTGAKSSEAVRRKLRTPRYCLSAAPLPEGTIFTAAEAQVEFMADNIPEGAKVFVVTGGGDFWYRLLQQKCPDLLETWEVRTSLTEEEAKQWATIAAVHPKTPIVWVVLFIDGPLSNCPDPKTGAPSPTDWSYELVRNCSYVLGHGAQLVYTADDSSNPAIDDAYGGYVWPQPGPGMFAAMLTRIMQPRGAKRVHCLGKGGNAGKKYMMERAIAMLMEQGHSGDRSTIMMVGDRFDTDIRAGRSAGIRTCLVESGAHKACQQREYPDDLADFIADGLGAMHALTHSPQLELPMVMRQPLRLWVLSFGNVVRADAAAKGSNLKLDECLQEFYKREASLSGGSFGKRQLMKAFDEIGLEVSEHQVEACLSGLLAWPSKGTISFQLFSSLMRQAMQNVGIDLHTSRVSERTMGRIRQAVVRSAGRRRGSLAPSSALWDTMPTTSPMASGLYRRRSTAGGPNAHACLTQAGGGAQQSLASSSPAVPTVNRAAACAPAGLPPASTLPGEAAVTADVAPGSAAARRPPPLSRPKVPLRPPALSASAMASIGAAAAPTAADAAATGEGFSHSAPASLPMTPLDELEPPCDLLLQDAPMLMRSASSPPEFSPTGIELSLADLGRAAEAAEAAAAVAAGAAGAATKRTAPATMPRATGKTLSTQNSPADVIPSYSNDPSPPAPRAPFSAPRLRHTMRRRVSSSSKDLLSGGALFTSPPKLFEASTAHAGQAASNPETPTETPLPKAASGSPSAADRPSGSGSSIGVEASSIQVPVVFGTTSRESSPAAASVDEM